MIPAPPEVFDGDALLLHGEVAGVVGQAEVVHEVSLPPSASMIER